MWCIIFICSDAGRNAIHQQDWGRSLQYEPAERQKQIIICSFEDKGQILETILEQITPKWQITWPWEQKDHGEIIITFVLKSCGCCCSVKKVDSHSRHLVQKLISWDVKWILVTLCSHVLQKNNNNNHYCLKVNETVPSY